MGRSPPSQTWHRARFLSVPYLLFAVSELSGQLPHQLVAGLLAAAACFGADAAVLHAMLAVLIALVAADLAGRCAGFEGGADHLRLRGRLPGDDPAGGVTDIGAVQVEPDAAVEHLRFLLAEAGVGAGSTGLGTVEASLAACSEGLPPTAVLGLVWIICWA